jgi:virulence factor Mce-like protein
MTQALKVGIFATIVLLLLAWFVLKIEDLNPFAPQGRVIDAVFESIAGLDDRSAVRIAGVRVGTVDGIELADDNRRARVHLRLDEPLGLTEGTFARISNLGLLGDKYVELVPGPPEAALLPEVAVIPGMTMPGFDDAMATLNEVANSIRRVADPLAAGLSGEGPPTPISRLIGNLEATSAEIRLLVEGNRGQLDATIANFETFSAALARELPPLVARMEALLAQVDAVVAENRGALGESAQNVAELTGELRGASRDLSAIAGRLERGEGTIGQLLTSDEAHDELVATLGSVQSGVGKLSDTLGRVDKLRLDLDLGGFYLPSAEESHGSLGLTLIPSEDSDKLYRIALSQTPHGDTRTKTEEALLSDIINPNGAIDANYLSYTVATANGQILNGLIASETASALTLLRAEGQSDTVLKRDVEEIRSDGVSLMPEGIEQDITVDQMADLLDYLKNWRYMDGAVPVDGGR